MFYFDQVDDEQAMEIQSRIQTEDVRDLVIAFPELTDDDLIEEIVHRINHVSKNVPV